MQVRMGDIVLGGVDGLVVVFELLAKCLQERSPADARVRGVNEDAASVVLEVRGDVGDVIWRGENVFSNRCW